MRCPQCGTTSDRVVDSRESQEGDAIRRRRECEGCGCRFTTYERIGGGPLVVVKKDGRREAFSREKLLVGLFRALHRRDVDPELVHEFARGFEQRLGEAGEREVQATAIGDKVMEFLRRHDPIAWVRFASVYCDWQDIGQLLQAAQQLENDPQAGAPTDGVPMDDVP
jgi:transcriptional repressor NrdR